MSGSEGPPIGPPPGPVESPYRREVIKTSNKTDEFEICSVKDRSTTSTFLRRTTEKFVHLKEDDDGLYWNILIIPPDGEPQNYTLREDQDPD